MTDIEEEIRRQMQTEKMQTEKQAQSQSQTQSQNQTSGNGFSVPHYAQTPPQNQSKLEKTQAKGGILGVLATIGIVLAKFGALVLAVLGKLKFLAVFGKVALTGGSMLLSMWAYSTYYGWPFGVGFVVLIFVHECGHALACLARGLPVKAMVFIPFLGAFVTHRIGRSIAENGFIALMGPVAGTLGSLVCVGIFYALPAPSPFWIVLAQFNFLINLFNLLPVGVFDGGKIAAVFWPKLAGGSQDDPYFQATPAQKRGFAAAYFGLIVFLTCALILCNGLLAAFRAPSSIHAPLGPIALSRQADVLKT